MDSLALPGRPADAAQLIPPTAPSQDAVVRQVLDLLAGQSATVGADIQLVQNAVGQAAGAGTLPHDLADALIAILKPLMKTDEAELSEGLQRWTRHSSESLEAKLARALTPRGQGDITKQLTEDVRALLDNVQNHEPFMKALEQGGQMRSFDTAINRIIDRIIGAQIQNLRGVDQPYLFIEVPFGDERGVRRAQVHFFSGGRGGQGRFDPNNATIVMDLSLTRLGDLWIRLDVANRRCKCVLSASDPEVVTAIEDQADGLQQALSGAGYTDPIVQARLWNGDRMNEVTVLMRGLSGMDITA